MFLNIFKNLFKEKRGIMINTLIMLVLLVFVLTVIVLVYIGFRTGTLEWIKNKVLNLFKFGGIQ